MYISIIIISSLLVRFFFIYESVTFCNPILFSQSRIAGYAVEKSRNFSKATSLVFGKSRKVRDANERRVNANDTDAIQICIRASSHNICCNRR